MHDRFSPRALLLIALALPFAGCTNALIDTLAITPVSQSLTVGQTVQFTATGTVGHGNGHPSTTQDDTDSVTWTSSSPSVATINSTGMATAVAAGSTTITASMNGYTGTITASATLTVTAATVSPEPILSLSITPGLQSLAQISQTAQFIAIGTTATGTTVNLTNQTAKVGTATINAAIWSSSVPAVGTISATTGVATSVGAGTTTITAIVTNPDGTVVTGSASLAVTSTNTSTEPIVSLGIIPASQTLTATNQTAGFIVLGTTGSGTTVNLTNQVATVGSATINAAIWTSSVPSAASINSATGVATALTNGVTAITAVASNPDGTVVTATVPLTVSILATQEPIVSLAIVPGSQTASIIGQTAQYIVVGTTSTGSTVNLTNQPATVGTATIGAAKWGSSSAAIATINANTGLATVPTGAVNGVTVITATASNPDGTAVTATATLTVNITSTSEPLVSMAIVPGSQTASVIGQTVQYVVIGTTSTGSTVNLTNQPATIGASTINAAKWGSSSANIATINQNTGFATVPTGAVSGVTVITATATNPDGTAVSAEATLTVNITATSEPLVSLTIVPGSQTTSVVGQTVQYIAIGTTSTGSTVNLTNQVATVGTATISAAVWGSSSGAIATVNPASGVATAVGSGTVAITAQARNPDGTVVTGTATFTVTATPEPLVSLAIVPAAQTASVIGQTVQYVVIGTTSTGATVNLTNQPATVGTATIGAAKWGSSSLAIATINQNTGLATVPVGAVNGVTVITATAVNPDGTAVTATATLTVNITATSEPIVSLAVVPSTQTTSVVGQTVQYVVIGTTSTGSTVNLTNQSAIVGSSTIAAAVWGSSSGAIATVNPASGVATAVGSGTVAITAQARNPDGTVVTGTATFTVTPTPEPLVSLAIVPGSQIASVIGQTVQYVVIGTTSTGATVNLTNQPATVGTATIGAAKWGSSSLAIATINQNTGLATVPVGAVNGVTVITATTTNPDGTAVTATATLTVNITATSEPIVSLTIIPGSQSTSVVGQTVQYIVLGTTSTGSTVNLTNVPATVGTATIKAAVWGTSSSAFATINPNTGIATAVSPGTVAITAIAYNPDNTAVTGTATFTVISNQEPLVSLAIIPDPPGLTIAGQTEQFIAIGTTSSGATVNLTSSSATVDGVVLGPVIWGSSILSVATIGTTGVGGAAPGLAVAGISGSTAITAIAYNPDGTVVVGDTVLSVSSSIPEPIVSLAVVPASNFGFAVNQTAQFIAIGTTSTGTTVNLTSQQAVLAGGTVQPAVWASTNPAIATAGPGGVVEAVSSGSTAITAAVVNPDGTVVTGTAAYTVKIPGSSEPIVSIAVTPVNPAPIAGGATVNLTATGTSGGGATVTNPTVVWVSSDPGVATVNGSGTVTGVGSGVTAITATATNPDLTTATGVSVVTVTSAAVFSGSIASIAVIPGSQAVAAPLDTAQFIAIGTTTTGATVDLTHSAQLVWSSSSAQIANIIVSGVNAGLATATGQGEATITAEYTPAGGGNVVGGTATFDVSGGSAEEFTAVTVIPNTQAISASGQISQFIAIGTVGSTGLQLDVTDPSTLPPGTKITWSSDVKTVALVSATGQVTGQGPGTTTITAELTNPDNTVVAGSATVTASLTAPPSPLLSLAIIPNTISVGNLQDTTQFIAIGTFSTAPYVQDVTNSVNTTWISSWPDVFPVDNSSGGTGTTGTSGGLVTAYGSGNATIIAEYKDPASGSIQTATATFNCPLVLPNPNGNPPTPGSCFPGSQAPALKSTTTIYNEGLNTVGWLVTAPSATGTPDVIHCGPGWTGPGGSVCAAPYPVGTTVLITAPAEPTVYFGGWSSSCTPSDAAGNPLPGPVFYNAVGPNYCIVSLSASNPNVTIGVIFNSSL